MHAWQFATRQQNIQILEEDELDKGEKNKKQKKHSNVLKHSSFYISRCDCWTACSVSRVQSTCTRQHTWTQSGCTQCVNSVRLSILGPYYLWPRSRDTGKLYVINGVNAFVCFVVVLNVGFSL